jgi:hypothetical protein
MEIRANEPKHHFSHDEEALMKSDPSTTVILNKVKDDTNAPAGAVDVRGDDKTFRELREHEKEHFGAVGVFELGHAAVDALDGLEIHVIAAATAQGVGAGIAAGVTMGGAVAGLAVGSYELYEANVRGKEQAEAIAKDEMHVALLGQLELPAGYRQEELAKRDEAGRGFQSVAQKMVTPFATKDKALVATLQLHADRGMNAARDLVASGLSKEGFLKSNPKIAEAYAKDPAFHHGFDALAWAHGRSPEEYKAALQALDQRDGWYSQSNVSFRV